MSELCLIPPAGEPIHVEEVKLDRRIIDSADDGRIRSLVAAARQHAEMQTRLQLLHARWQLTLDAFPMYGCLAPFARPSKIPEHAIILPHSPLVKVVSIQYLDMSGALQTMDPADYVVKASNTPALITPQFGKIWPIALPEIGAVTVTYDAGYASPFTVNTTNGQITVNGPVTWNVGDRVQFYGSGGEGYKLPAPLDQDASYLIASAPGNGVYTLSDQAGNAIAFTDAGQGTGRAFIGVVPDGIRSWMLLRVGAMYENREEVAVGQRVVVLDLPYVDGLLDPFRTSLP
jgi:uncharacterized phiE125 gp8 family phage protein